MVLEQKKLSDIDEAFLPVFDSAPMSQVWATLLMLLYLVILTLPLALASMGKPVPASKFIKEIALGFGLVGLMIIATSFFLAARYQWVTKPFGLDAVMLFHRRMAIVGLFALLLHIVLLSFLNIHLLTRLWLPWNLQLGRIAILLLAVQIMVSIFRVRMRVEFEKWRFSHRILAVGILTVAFFHGFYSSGAFAPWPMRIVIVAVIVTALWSIIWSRMIRPSRLREYRYQVHDVREITPAVWQVKLKPAEGGRALRYNPGQFAFFHFHRSDPNSPGEEHVWTIASSPSETEGLMLAIKELGDFTRTISHIRPGNAVTVHGPFGRFSHQLHPGRDDLVFIAGGIGITPFRSMIRWISDRHEHRRVLLLYANKSVEDIPFLDELTDCRNRSNGNVRIINVLSRPDEKWNGEKGHINIDLIQKYCEGNLAGKTFWICGPGAFSAAMIDSLRAAGVSPDSIHTEAFCLVHAPVQTDGRGRSLKTLCAALCIITLLMVMLSALIRTDFLRSPRKGTGHVTKKAFGVHSRNPQ